MQPGEQARRSRGEEGAAAVAVIDFGTNSTRLLIADVDGERVTELERRTRVTRLGRGLDLAGSLAAEAVEAVCEVVSEYVALCEQLGIPMITTIATSAVRDASNGDAFIAELRERFALSARVLEGGEEALLSYRGATAKRRDRRPVLVIDIGGGSTELIVGRGPEVLFHASLQAGVVRFSERYISADPPDSAELEALAADVRGLIEGALADEPAPEAEAAIAVAGTPTSLAAIELGLDPYDPALVHGHRMSIDSVQHMLSRLASLPLAQRREVVGLDPERAPTIVAGVVILIEAMRAFGLAGIEASEHDVLHGAAIEAAQSRTPNSE